MGWRINLVDNTVNVPSGLAEDLLRADEYQEVFYNLSEVTTKEREGRGKRVKETVRLHFNRDHQEHMDWVWREELQEVLLRYEVKGDITFCDFDGDNYGEFWGYRFDGKGGMTKLKGRVEWDEVK